MVISLSARPRRHLAVLTCMDCRLDPLAMLGLELGDAHVFRNAGARVTDDVLRSLAVSSRVLGVDTLTIIQHSGCGMLGRTDTELRNATGADIDFFPISDHQADLEADVGRVLETPYLNSVTSVTGMLVDTDTGELEQLVERTR